MMMMNPLASSNNHKHAVAMATKIANNTGNYGTKDQKMDRIQKLIQENNSVIALINIKSQEGDDCRDDLNTLLLYVMDTNTKKQIMKSKFQLGHLVASFGFVLKNYFNNDGGRGT
jgi:hypothetical protein